MKNMFNKIKILSTILNKNAEQILPHLNHKVLNKINDNFLKNKI